MIRASDYIPHKGPMILITEIVNPTENDFTVRVDLTQSNIFKEPEGVPTCIGIEYMAQSIAAYSNYFDTQPGIEPFLGFLVSCRNYNVTMSFFDIARNLDVKVKPILVDNNSGVFESSIFLDSQEIASGTLTTYKPEKNQLEDLKELK